MQMLFKELDQAFSSIVELRLDGKPHARFLEVMQADSSGQEADEFFAQDRTEALERLHDRLMLLGNEAHYPEAMAVLQKMLDLVTSELGISRDTAQLNSSHVGHAVLKSMTLFRFYLHLIKTEAYLHGQIGNLEIAKAALEKVLEFDVSNRLGARELLQSLPGQMNSATFRSRSHGRSSNDSPLVKSC